MKTDALSEKYKPIPLNLKKELVRAMRRPGFKAAWDALEEEYATLVDLLGLKREIPKNRGHGNSIRK